MIMRDFVKIQFLDKNMTFDTVCNHSKISLNILQAKSSSPQGIKVSQGEKTLKVDIEQGSQ